MATLTVSEYYTLDVKTTKGNYTTFVVKVTQTSAQLSSGSWSLNNRENIKIVNSLVGLHNGTEAICNLNFGESVEVSDGTHTLIVTRNDATHYSGTFDGEVVLNNYNLSSTCLSLFGGWAVESSDGVFFARPVEAFGYSTANYELSTLGFFPLLTLKDEQVSYGGSWLNNRGTPFGALVNRYKSAGELLKNSIAPSDPYSGAGDSETGGGDGTFDGSSDPVPVPALPSVGATDAGFITLFAPTPSQLKALATYMWSSAFDIEGGGTAIAFKKLFNDPMDCILGLSVVPVAVPTSGAREITVGNLVTTVSMNVASQQYVEVNCGTVDFTRKFFGSYLDYEPYTKMSIFVPYSGVHSVNADDIMGKIVQLVYHIDILTGSLVAFLKCGDSVLYEFNGACASNIPVNSLNYASTIENAIRIAVNIGTTVATAGAAAPLTGANAAERMAARTAATTLSTAGSTAEGAISMKPGIDRAGSLGGTTGLMGNQIPYFIITRPRLCKPKNQDFYKGYPSFIQTTLGDLEGKGYTEFDTVILAKLYLTDTEKSELLNILVGGVYL